MSLDVPGVVVHNIAFVSFQFCRCLIRFLVRFLTSTFSLRLFVFVIRSAEAGDCCVYAIASSTHFISVHLISSPPSPKSIRESYPSYFIKHTALPCCAASRLQRFSTPGCILWRGKTAICIIQRAKIRNAKMKSRWNSFHQFKGKKKNYTQKVYANIFIYLKEIFFFISNSQNARRMEYERMQFVVVVGYVSARFFFK